jgi:tRNA threonylcarbamoyladenosine biosynthesis protein TsaE
VYETNEAATTKELGIKIGSHLKGGEVFAVASDLGGGKTTFISGLVKGFGSNDPVASPTFTISFVYTNESGRRLHHFDFYRLDEPGILAHEINEALESKDDVLAIEWGDSIQGLLPSDTIGVQIQVISDTERKIIFQVPDSRDYVFKGVV